VRIGRKGWTFCGYGGVWEFNVYIIHGGLLRFTTKVYIIDN